MDAFRAMKEYEATCFVFNNTAGHTTSVCGFCAVCPDSKDYVTFF